MRGGACQLLLRGLIGSRWTAVGESRDVLGEMFATMRGQSARRRRVVMFRDAARLTWLLTWLRSRLSSQQS